MRIDENGKWINGWMESGRNVLLVNSKVETDGTVAMKRNGR